MGCMTHVRRALPTDIPAVMCMKRTLMDSHGLSDFCNASEQDWLRDAFGPERRFSVAVAERDDAVIGFAIYTRWYSPGWVGSMLYLQDLFVSEAHRRQGIATQLLQRVAIDALEWGVTMIELNVRADNPAGDFYHRVGFEHASQCLTFVMPVPSQIQLAEIARNMSGTIDREVACKGNRAA